MTGSAEVQRERTKQIKQAICATPAHCTTLTEFHLVWRSLFHVMSSPTNAGGWGQSSVARYLSSTYFFKLPVLEAQQQYNVQSAPTTEEGVLCAAWWAGYARLQPGSASGRAATAYGKQGEKATCLPGKPTFKDPELRNGVRLACAGRTTAAEYFARKHFVHACTTAAVKAAYVVPISFLKQKHIAPARGVARAQIEYVPTPEEELRLPAATARLLVQAATEPDIDILAGLWSQLHIASGRSGAAVSLHWDTWHRLRTRLAVVLAPERPICLQPAKNIQPQVVLLCSCLPFAFERSVRARRPSRGIASLIDRIRSDC